MFGIEQGTLLVILIVGAVLLFNVGLLYGLMSGSTRQQIDMLRRAARKARNPWAAEDEALRDLHGRVGRLGATRSADGESDEPD